MSLVHYLLGVLSVLSFAFCVYALARVGVRVYNDYQRRKMDKDLIAFAEKFTGEAQLHLLPHQKEILRAIMECRDKNISLFLPRGYGKSYFKERK